MVYAHPVQTVDGIEELQEHVLDELVVAHIQLRVCDHGEEIPVRTVFEHDKEQPHLFDGMVNVYDSRKACGLPVHAELASDLGLVRIRLVEQAFDGDLLPAGRMKIHSEVDDAVSASAETVLEKIPTIADSTIREGGDALSLDDVEFEIVSSGHSVSIP